MVRTFSERPLFSRSIDSTCSSVHDSGGGVMAKKLSRPLSSGPGGMSIAPPKARRNGGVQMIWSGSSGEADEVALADERQDALVLGAAEVEQLIGLRMVGADGVEHSAGERVGVVGHRLVADPGRPQLPGQAQHLGPDLVVGRGGARAPARPGVIVALRRVVELALVQVAAEPEVAVGGRQQVVAEPADEGVDRGDGRLRGLRHARRAATSSTSAAISTAVRHRSATPGIVSIAFSVWKPRDRAASPGGQVGPGRIEHGRDALHPSRRAGEPLLTGANSRERRREQAAAQQVGVDDRAPRQLVELLLVEAQLVDRGQQDAPVDLLFAGRGRRCASSEARASASQASRSARPASVRSGHAWSCSWLPASVAWIG